MHNMKFALTLLVFKVKMKVPGRLAYNLNKLMFGLLAHVRCLICIV
jgi:hypothetical protein